jgi:hypothetical protein
MPPFKLPYTL